MEEEELASYELALLLQADDVLDLYEADKGKGAVSRGLTDAQLAICCYAAEIGAVSRMFADMRMAQSLDQAVESDAEELIRFQAEEEQASRDHRLAASLSEGEPVFCPLPVTRRVESSSRASSSKEMLPFIPPM